MSAARQRPRPDAEIVGGEVSLSFLGMNCFDGVSAVVESVAPSVLNSFKYVTPA
jgi:hypothetical protein